MRHCKTLPLNGFALRWLETNGYERCIIEGDILLTPERHSGGLSNVLTVLSELAEKIDATQLLETAAFSPTAWTQRLGYLLEILGKEEKANILAAYIGERKPVRTPLVPGLTTKGSKSNAHWRLFINSHLEADI